MPPSDALARRIAPATTALLTVECQRGVVGEGSALPELAALVRETGVLERIADLVESARAAGVQVVHAVAERRPDGRGANRNAPLFRAVERLPVRQLAGTDAVRIAPPVTVGDGDLVTRRLHGLSPLAGTGVDALLRNLGRRTVVVVGVSANVAVPNAVFDLVNLGYTAVVVEDAIAGVPAVYTRAMVRYTLGLVATVASTAEVRECWRGAPEGGQGGSPRPGGLRPA
ncbi:isochorismatase family protein [Streptomyces sp. NPDC057638]|uniref:isochorismatase family protein n=1 Tax=Streptomyces sp. NPDC057638 TaxID=3346190 RepID=UPI0036D1A17C